MAQAQVKKVKAFPIAATLAAGTVTLPAQIVKMTLTGFLAEIPRTGFKTGEKFTCVFEIPVTRASITEICVVIKHYSHWTEKDGAKVPGYLIEAHFQALSPDSTAKLVKFLNASKKAGGSAT